MAIVNLWEETIIALSINGHSWEDVIYVCGDDFSISKQNFESVAKETDYDNGYGLQQIASDLMLIGDNWWYVRKEYDGKEWWEHITKPTPNSKLAIIGSLSNDSNNTLQSINFPNK